MQNRIRLLMGATALLYFGPLLAGLGGFGWAVVPVFAAIFMLWLVILRPRQFPRTLSDWKKPEAQVAVASRLLIQILLVAVCFGIGRGIGGIAGALPPFPLMLPIAISFLAIPLARMIWDPWKADKMENFLDDAIRKIKGSPKTEAEMAEQSAYIGGMLEPLSKLPANTTDADIVSHLNALRDHVEEDVMFDHLFAQVQDGSAKAGSRRALVLLGSDSDALAGNIGAEFGTRAMQAVRGDDALVALLARRLIGAISEDDAVLDDCPDAQTLRDLLAGHPGAAADLQALLSITENLVASGAD
jgi:hypothetical protein